MKSNSWYGNRTGLSLLCQQYLIFKIKFPIEASKMKFNWVRNHLNGLKMRLFCKPFADLCQIKFQHRTHQTVEVTSVTFNHLLSPAGPFWAGVLESLRGYLQSVAF